MRRRCLVLGASGQLGRALCAEFAPWHTVIPAVRRAPETGQWKADLSDPDGLVTLLEHVRPEWILIAGAYCQVDAAESASDLCRQVNVDGPRVLAEYAATQGAMVVYYSTDSVFDGKQNAYLETDLPHPLNVYAVSKADGEAAVRALLPRRHLILRAAWLYGPDEQRRNFILSVVDRLRRGEEVRVANDQWGSPTYTDDLAAATRVLLEGGWSGTFHATGPELVCRAALAQRACAAFGVDAGRLVPVATDQLRQAARRPLQVRLDCRKLQAAVAPAFRGVQDGLAALRAAQAIADVSS